MLRRLDSFAESDPRKAARVIFALATALCVVLVGTIIALADIQGMFESPYPTEATPLTWTEYSVTWTAADTVVFDERGHVSWIESGDPSEFYAEHPGTGRNYSNMFFTWEIFHGVCDGPVANDSEQQQLSLGSPVLVESWVGGTYGLGLAVEYVLVIADLQGNGAFDLGDSITFKYIQIEGTPIAEDEVFTVALVCLEPTLLGVGEFSFAIHDGEFYSWRTHELSWDEPWWE